MLRPATLDLTMPSRSFLILLVLILAGGYVGLNLLVKWIYPKQLFPYRGSSYEDLPGLHLTPAEDGNQIAFVYLPAENPDAPFLFYLHGNGEDIGTNTDRFSWFHEQGYSLIALDYPGYGKSTGEPSGESVRAATRAVWEYAEREFLATPANTVIWGRSLGGAPATYLATQDSFRGLILESTFRSVFAVANLPFPVFLQEPFPTESRIREVKSPIVIFHGDLDRTIPVSHAHKLAAAAGDGAEIILLPEGSHNDLRFIGGEEMKVALAKFRQDAPSLAR